MKKIFFLSLFCFSFSIFANELDSYEFYTDNKDSNQKEIDRLYYNFSSLPVGHTTFRNFIITNTSDFPLSFSSAQIRGAGFFASHNCRRGLVAKRGQCRFAIQYSPPFNGFHFGQFRIAFKENYEVVVDITGQGI